MYGIDMRLSRSFQRAQAAWEAKTPYDDEIDSCEDGECGECQACLAEDKRALKDDRADNLYEDRKYRKMYGDN
jgi:hypothetical protein